MRGFMHMVWATALWCLSALAVTAQETDKDFLTRTIQDALSGAGRAVSIDGFRGALSSSASFDQMTIADDEGVWVTLSEVTLVWTRSALLRGRLEVDTLSAKRLDLPRLPKTQETETLPDAEAKPFSLPDLPVSVNIADFSVEQIHLGAPILGEAAQLNIKASAQLSDTQGDIDFVASRTDGREGVFEIKANLNRTDNVLDLLLNLREQEDGIAARLLNLPGHPDVEMRVRGSGPIDAFATDVRIATEGAERLTGKITIGAQTPRRPAPTPDRRILADIGGDITALLAPQYRDFFGTDVGLKVDTLLESSGAIEVSDFALSTLAANLRGQVTLNQDRWPTLIDITGAIANPDGAPTLLPIGVDGATVQQVDLRVAYDAADGEAFAADFDLAALSLSSVDIAQATLGFDGILQGNLGSVGQFLADMRFDAQGLELSDAASAQALGNQVTGIAEINYIEGQPIRINDIDLSGTDYGLTGGVVINGVDDGLLTRLNAVLKADDLSRFSALAGRELDGKTDLALKGVITPLSGAFDLAIRGSTQDVRLGIAQVDAVMTGRTELTLEALRNETGTFLQDVELANDALNLEGRAALRSGQSDAVANFTLKDVALVVPQYSGPVSVQATVNQDANGWRVQASTDGPYGAVLSVSGLATGPNAALTFNADVPDIDPLARPFVPELNERLDGPVMANGTLRQSPDGWQLETTATGPFEARVQLDGVVAPNLALRFDLNLPSLTPISAQLDGPLAAQGELHQTADGFEIDAQANGPFEVAAKVSGPLTPVMDLQFDADLPDVAPLAPQIEGAVTAQGRLRQTNSGFEINTTATGPYNAEAKINGALTPTLDLAFDVSLPDVNPLAPQVSGAATAQGRLRQGANGFEIDTIATGPYAARAQIDGALTPALDLNFDVALPEVNVLVPQVNGPLTAQGRLRQNDQGFLIDTTARGPYAAVAEVNGILTPAIDLSFDVSLPNVNPLAPQLNGPAALRGKVRQEPQGFVIDTTANGPYGLRAQLDGLATGPDMALNFQAGLPNVRPLVPGMSGPLAANGVLRQTPAGIAVETSANGPYASRAGVRGVVTGPDAAVDFDFSMPNLGVLVDRVNGPLNLTGTAAKEGSAWRVNTSADGPSGTQARVAGLVNGDGTLAMNINGTAPLGLSRPFIAPRNLQGQARFDLALNGPAALSSLSGTIQTSNAALSAPNLRVALTDIQGNVQLSGSRAALDIGANASNGGTLRVGGGVTLIPALPADITVGLRDIVLIDPRLYRTSVSGDLRVSGPLTGNALIAGQVNIGETAVNVPSTGLTSIGDIPQITHIGARPGVITTRNKAGLTGAASGNDPAADATGPGFGLDLRVNAPNRIFVRGRGLDAELGGTLSLSGSTNRVISTGQFELIRGRLDILGRRFTLEEGNVQFQGDLVPFLRFVSATDTPAGEVRVIVEGPADAPEVNFEATPEAPQDEVLSQLLFGRNISEISAFQALQLASAVATLAGRGGGGIISNLRDGFGLDDLDVTTTQDGATALRLGKYLTENVYTDVTASSDGTADVSLNLDITPNLTGRATLGSDGDSSIGIFFERDY